MMEKRYTIEQISKAVGMNKETVERLRKWRVGWSQRGYTLEEVKTILKGYPPLPREAISPRAWKALELRDRLEKEGGEA